MRGEAHAPLTKLAAKANRNRRFERTNPTREMFWLRLRTIATFDFVATEPTHALSKSKVTWGSPNEAMADH